MITLGTPHPDAPPLSHRPGWDYTYHLLIIRGATPQILLARDEEGWALPRFRPIEHDLRAVGHIERAVRQSLGLATRVLRCLAVDRSQAEAKRMEAVFALELLTGDSPSGIELLWAGAADLDEIPMTIPSQRELASLWLNPRDVSHAATNYPWALPNWQDGAVAWVGEQLGRRAIGPIVAIGQVRTWSLSCVLRIDTPQGAYYLKALPPAYRPEVAVTTFLAARFPGRIPAVIAADLERGWLLLADVGPPMENDRLDLWEGAVTQIAAIQRASIPIVAPLLALGCADQRLDALAAQAGTLPANPHVRSALPDDGYRALCALVPRLQERCARLAEYDLPATLVHGDLHTGNIARRGDRLTFFDWGDACIAHPFVVLFALLDEEYLPRGATDAAAHLRDRYLAQWGDFGLPARLREALSLAESLAALRYTLGCVRCFPGLDELWTRELSRSLRASLHSLLTAG